MNEERINKYMYKLYNDEQKSKWKSYFVLHNQKSTELSKYIESNGLKGENEILEKIERDNGRIYLKNMEGKDYTNWLEKLRKEIIKNNNENISIDEEKINKLSKNLTDFCNELSLKLLEHEGKGFKLNDFKKKDIGDIYELNRTESIRKDYEIVIRFYNMKKEINSIFTTDSYKQAVEHAYYTKSNKYDFSLNHLLNRIRHMQDDPNDEYMYIWLDKKVEKMKISLSVEDIISIYDTSFSLINEIIKTYSKDKHLDQCFEKNDHNEIYLNENTDTYKNANNTINKKNKGIYNNNYTSITFIKDIYSDFTYNLLGIWRPLNSQNNQLKKLEIKRYILNLFNIYFNQNNQIDFFLSKTKFLTRNIWKANKINYILKNINTRNEFVKEEIILQYLFEFVELKTYGEMNKELSNYLYNIVGKTDSKKYFSTTFKLIRILSEFKIKFEDENIKFEDQNIKFVKQINKNIKEINFYELNKENLDKIKILKQLYENHISMLENFFSPIFVKDNKRFPSNPNKISLPYFIYMSFLSNFVNLISDNEMKRLWVKYFIQDENLVGKAIFSLDNKDVNVINYISANVIKFLGFPRNWTYNYSESIDFPFNIYFLFNEDVIKLYLIANKKKEYILKITGKLENKIREILDINKNDYVKEILLELETFVTYLVSENFNNDRILMWHKKINDKEHVLQEIKWYLKSDIFERIRYEKTRTKEQSEPFFESINSVCLINNYESIIGEINLLRKNEWNKIIESIKGNEINFLKELLKGKARISEFKTYDGKNFQKTYTNIYDINLDEKMIKMIIEKSKTGKIKEKKKLWIENIIAELNKYNDAINKVNELKEMFFKTYTIKEKNIESKIYKRLKNKYKV